MGSVNVTTISDPPPPGTTKGFGLGSGFGAFAGIGVADVFKSQSPFLKKCTFQVEYMY